MRNGFKVIITAAMIAITVTVAFFLARGGMDLRSTLQVEENRPANENTIGENTIGENSLPERQAPDANLASPLPPLGGFFPNNNLESTPPEDL